MVFFFGISSSFAFLASIPLIFLSLTQSTFSSEQLSLLRLGLALQQSRCASRGLFLLVGECVLPFSNEG
jgi:hypothetical protein